MNIDPKIIEKAAKALHELACVDTLAGHACGHSSHEGDANHLEAAVVLHEVADDLRAEGAAEALREAADDIDKEEAEEAAKVRMGNVRCLVCELEWNQRSHFGCHGDYHEFDGADLSRAGEVRIEETYAGQFLCARAAALEAGQS